MKNIKDRFPIFKSHPDLIYLDNAATTQRVDKVDDLLDEFNRKDNATIHRGVYELSAKATARYEQVRSKVAGFLGSDNPNTIAFTKGTTESINVVAHSFIKKRLRAGDNIVVTVMEHHANFVPWQALCKEMGCELRVASLTPEGSIDTLAFERLVDKKTKMVAITHLSNVLGTINPIEQLIETAHAQGAPVLVDAAQGAALYDLDVTKLNYDFLAFSAHKLFGPFGVGILYVNPEYMGDMQPYTLGGGIIQSVSADEVTFQSYPFNLDAGTPNVSGVLGLGAAIDFLNELNRAECISHTHELANRCVVELARVKGIRILGGTQMQRSGIVSFALENIHPHDVSSYLNGDGIAVRAGLHCAQPLHYFMKEPSTIRISFSIYNADNEIDILIDSIKSLKKFWEQ
ncbi:MAG: cysteine desulfurase [Bacteroidota bacterium]